MRLDLAVPVLAITCLHLAADCPFCWEDRVISLAAVPAAADEPFATSSPGAWLIGEVPWNAAEHRISAVAADAGMAALKLPVGTPCLCVERRTWNADHPVTHVRLIYPGGSHALVARFAPSKAG
jgi:GntR family histidine utilization transcriptional repressor